MARKTKQSWYEDYTAKLGDRYRPPTYTPTYAPDPYEDMKGRKGKRKPPPPPHVVTLGETYPDIADKYGVGVTDLMQGAENLTPIPGTAVDIPPRYPDTGLSVTPGYTPEPPPKVGLETGEPIDVGGGDFIQFPEGWNTARTMAMLPYMTMDFAGKYYDPEGYYTEWGGLGATAPPVYSPTKTGRAWGMPTDPRYGTPTEALPEIPGIPTYHAWTKDETGAWERQEEGAVFDALYEYNNIDPEDDAMVEWFWSMADEDLLGVGILFDVLDWGGEGGYPAPAAYGLGTPSRMAGRGQKPVRGEYASYLGLTSWSI